MTITPHDIEAARAVIGKWNKDADSGPMRDLIAGAIAAERTRAEARIRQLEAENACLHAERANERQEIFAGILERVRTAKAERDRLKAEVERMRALIEWHQANPLSPPCGWKCDECACGYREWEASAPGRRIRELEAGRERIKAEVEQEEREGDAAESTSVEEGAGHPAGASGESGARSIP